MTRFSMISKCGIARAWVAVALLGACADRSGAPVTFPAPITPAASIASPPAPAPDASSVARSETPVPISAAYTHDVWLVATPPLAIHMLASFDEAPPSTGAAFDCERALLDHARMLGGNRLYIDRSAPCRGTAYFVRPPRDTEADADADTPLRSGGPRGVRAEYEATLYDWIRARWRAPKDRSEEALRNLCTVVQFSTSEQLRIWNVRSQPIRSSGNAAFDASVHDALESAIDAHASLPEPPAGDEGRHFRRAQIRFAFSLGNTASCR